MIDGVDALRHFGAFRFLIGPVFPVVAALLDPAGDEIRFLLCEPVAFALRRHEIVVIVGDDAVVEFAGLRITRHDSRVATEIFQSALRGIEAQVGSAIFFVGAVAGEAAVG